MESLTMNEFRRQVGEYVNQTYYASKAFMLMKGEKKVAALLPIAMVNRLAELEAFQAQVMAERQQTESTNTDANPITEGQ